MVGLSDMIGVVEGGVVVVVPGVVVVVVPVVVVVVLPVVVVVVPVVVVVVFTGRMVTEIGRRADGPPLRSMVCPVNTWVRDVPPLSVSVTLGLYVPAAAYV